MGLLKMHKSGDLVRESGVYAVLHSTPHMLIEHEICFEGSRFRGCRVCPLGLLYKLETPSVPHTFVDLAPQGLTAS
jgi:hypothetical protein